MDESIHHIIIFAVILVILYLQVRQYRRSTAISKGIKSIFPNSAETSFRLVKYGTGTDAVTYKIEETDESDNETRKEILKSINDYLESNGTNASDFYLIKDIVERNCGMREDELQTHTPTPLYLGLMGTMMGILVGVGFLLLSGSLDSLLGAGNGNGADGIKALLSGVALAMVCSIMGLIFTTRLTIMGQDARSECDNRKNSFLSWVQTVLLPKMTSDAGSALRIMTTELTKFNKDFSENAKILDNALKDIRSSAEQQTQLMNAINKLDVTRLAKANVMVYEKLKNCVEELSGFADAACKCKEFAESTQNSVETMKGFVDTMQSIKTKLDEADERSRMIEEMAKFFKAWEGELKNAKSIANKTVADASVAMQDACAELGDYTKGVIDGLRKRNTDQIDIWEKALQGLNDRMCATIKQVEKGSNDQMAALQSSIDAENDAIKTRAGEMGRMADQIANLAGLTNTFESLNETLMKQNEQSQKVAERLDSITKDLGTIAKNSEKRSRQQQQKPIATPANTKGGEKEPTDKKGFANKVKDAWASITHRFRRKQIEKTEESNG